MIKRISHWRVFLFFGILLICELIILHPFGNFPLNDDWALSLSIYEYVHSGTIFYPALLAAFSIVPIMYGIGVSMMFGFSFVALRLTTVVLAWGCACFLYAFLRKNDFSHSVSIAVTTLLLASPLFINLSYTFMSEIPALFFLLGAIFFFSKGLQEKNYSAIAFGALFGVLGFFTRQTDIFVVIAAAAAYFSDNSMDRKKGLVIFGLCGTSLLVIVGLLQGAGIQASTLSVFYLPPDVVLRIMRTLSFILFFLTLTGLALLPVTGSIWMKGKKISDIRLSYQFIFSAGIVSVLGMLELIFFNQFQNIITFFGIGPAPFVMVGSIRQWGPTAIYIVATGLAIASAVYVFRIYINDAGSNFGKRPWNMFIWYYAALYFLFVSIIFPWFDRYYILLLPLACYCAAQLIERYPWRPKVFYAILACMGLYGMIGTYNYLTWNDARWRLGEQLISRGIARSEISGGMEWNGWFFYKDEIDKNIRDLPPFQNASGIVMDFLIHHDRSQYILSFSPMREMEIVDSINVHGIFSNIKKIYALKKSTSLKY